MQIVYYRKTTYKVANTTDIEETIENIIKCIKVGIVKGGVDLDTITSIGVITTKGTLLFLAPFGLLDHSVEMTAEEFNKVTEE